MKNNAKTLTKTFIGAQLLLFSFILSNTADAATVSYDLVGNMNAPLFWYRDTFSLDRYFPQGSHFHMNLNQGDVVLTYNDGDTASTADDLVTVTGTSSGCIGNQAGSNCHSDFKKAHNIWGTYQGTGLFEWDLVFRNPIDGLTSGADDFAFDQQQAGSITLLNPPAHVPATIDVMLKRDKDFAFRLFPDTDGDGVFDAEGWLAMRGGVLGAAGVRGEHGPNNSRLNWDLQLIRRGHTPPPPPEEVPEPASALLLGAGLLLLKRKNRA